MSAPRRYRLALTALLIVALVASLFVAAVRVRKEHGANRVELAMDYQDFSALAKSYGYNEEQFLVALRRAGLTSLAISEELGSNIDLGTGAVLLSGPQLIAQMRLSPLADPTLAALGRAGRIDPNDLYLIVYDPNELARYRSAIAMHLGAHATRTLRPAHPTILAIRSQIDYFNSLGLGLPAGQLALAHKLGLLVVPRVQNDERFDKSDIDATFAGFFAQHVKPTTVVFFGTRNEVLGFPDHLDVVADAFKRTHLSFGSIETYDKIQVQKGNDELARKIANQTTRVQAISKTELDKLDFETVVARYLLGARERNVRVVYLRPFPHATGDLSPEKTNIEMVRRIADGLRARGFRLGRATPIPDLPVSPVVIFVASLAVPAIFLLLLEAFGIRRAPLAYAVIAADVVLVALGYASGHGLLIRKLLALAGGIMFATMGVVAIPRAFTLPAPRALGASIVAGFRTLGVATGFALCGALVIVGLVSVPLLMEEIDHFSGVKLILAVPPLLALLLYIYTRRFGNDPPDARSSALAPVRVYQIAIVALLAGAAAIYVLRSGNQSDITPSAFELSLRSGLTAVLGVRPRFKEFLVGFPLMMLLPALRLEHRKLVGWLFAIGIAIGTSDIVDTFSHLHTPLVVSLLRVFNGAVIGAIVGILAILLYRAIWKPARA